MKEQQIQPRNKNTQKEQKIQVTENKEEQKFVRKNPEPPINPMVEPSRIKLQNEAIFHAANGQRKAMNIQRIRDFMQKRVQSFQERQRICATIKAMFFEKQKNTKAFLKNIIRFFEDYADLYNSLHKSIGKLQLKKKYENQQIYNSVKQAIAQLVQLNNDESDHIQKFIDWLQKILVQAFKSANNYFKDRLKKFNKDLETSQSNYSSSWSKQEKAYQKLTQGNDLLEKELILMQHIKNTNQAAVQRAVDLYQSWQFLLQQQNTIKRLLKDNILQFYDRFVKFHKKTESAASIFKYWSNLPLSPSVVTVFASFLDQKSVHYINFGSKSKNIGDNYQNFMRMVFQQQRVGNPYPYLQILIAKKFSSKLQLSQREWKDIKLIFTVDGNLLIVDEKQGKIVMKLTEGSIKLKRVSENILQLAGVQQGVIFNSKKKQSIHFETLDEVQQFVYYVNSIPGKNKEEEK